MHQKFYFLSPIFSPDILIFSMYHCLSHNQSWIFKIYEIVLVHGWRFTQMVLIFTFVHTKNLNCLKFTKKLTKNLNFRAHQKSEFLWICYTQRKQPFHDYHITIIIITVFHVHNISYTMNHSICIGIVQYKFNISLLILLFFCTKLSLTT